MTLHDVFYGWNGGNQHLFTLINQAHSPFSDPIMGLGTQLGNYLLLPFYLFLFSAMAFLNITRDPDLAVQQRYQLVLGWVHALTILCLLALLDGAFVAMIKHTLNYPRPLRVLPPDMVHVIGTPKYDGSFPSGHSSFAMMLVISLWTMLTPWQRGVGIFFVIWVGVSRVSSGAHFPADVLAGWLFVVPFFLLARMMIRRLPTEGFARWLVMKLNR